MTRPCQEAQQRRELLHDSPAGSYPDNPEQGTVRREWRALSKGCNTVLDYPGSSLRAYREAVSRVVAPLGKDASLPARRA